MLSLAFYITSSLIFFALFYWGLSAVSTLILVFLQDSMANQQWANQRGLIACSFGFMLMSLLWGIKAVINYPIVAIAPTFTIVNFCARLGEIASAFCVVEFWIKLKGKLLVKF